MEIQENDKQSLKNQLKASLLKSCFDLWDRVNNSNKIPEKYRLIIIGLLTKVYNRLGIKVETESNEGDGNTMVAALVKSNE